MIHDDEPHGIDWVYVAMVAAATVFACGLVSLLVWASVTV